jgi:hypothetical protein
MKTGQGQFTWKDGASFKGDLSKNKIHGTGCYTWPDGRVYNGGWENNKMHG